MEIKEGKLLEMSTIFAYRDRTYRKPKHVPEFCAV